MTIIHQKGEARKRRTEQQRAARLRRLNPDQYGPDLSGHYCDIYGLRRKGRKDRNGDEGEGA